MKKFFIAIVFFSHPVFAQTIVSKDLSQKQVARVIEEVTSIIKKNSIFKDSLDWKQISAELKIISPTIATEEDCSIIYKIFSKKLKDVGDNHSFFWTKMDIAKTSSATSTSPPENKITGKYLGSSIGYIKVPGCLVTNDIAAINFANSIRAHIKEVDTQNEVNAWVVDLRHNRGGNMWPMLAGLNALIQDAIVGYFILPNSKSEIKWISTNGQMMHSKGKIDQYKIRNLKGKIAVLIDSLTGSSGEMTAVSFSGGSNVKIFGVPSWGATTANHTHNLLLGAQLYLAESYIADKNHKMFLGKIIPDVIVEENKDGQDATLSAARNWLQQ